MTINGPAPIVPTVPVQSAHAAPPTATTDDVAPTPDTSVRAPDGVDATLWDMLTPDEQAFFANQSVLGPLTYAPVHEVSAADAPRGQRIDVRA